MAETLNKLDLAKFLSRSFLLPLLGMVGVFVLAMKGFKGEDLYIPGLCFGGFSGLFSIQDVAKLFAAKKGVSVNE